MDRYTYLLYTIYSLIIIMIIIFFVSVFNDSDYKLGFYNYVDSYVHNKCYPIRKTPEPVIQKDSSEESLRVVERKRICNWIEGCATFTNAKTQKNIALLVSGF